MKVKESRKILDQWLPPEGAGRPITCIATSFTFDPDFFERDCLSRFLGLDSEKGESDPLMTMVEQDERLSESPVTVLVDRSDSPGNRNLRWDLLPIGVRGGLMHAKVAVLAWENIVRFIVGSANLTPAGYRRQVETVAVLDAIDGTEIDRGVFLDLIDALRRIIDRAPGDPALPGPKPRALRNLKMIEERVQTIEVRAPKRPTLRLAVVIAEPGRPALAQFSKVWVGGPPRNALVMSPFFDTNDPTNLAAKTLAAEMAQRGERSVHFVVQVDRGDSSIVRAPHALTSAMPRGFDVSFEAFKDEHPAERRRLHAKAVILQSDSWTALMVGSSNFTAAGLGLLERAGHFEINLAFGSGDKSHVKQLEKLIPDGEPFDPQAVRWEPEADEDETARDALPWGFVECVVDPGSHPTLTFRLDARDLPREWSILSPAGDELLTSARWIELGSPADATVELASPKLPFWVDVLWRVKRLPKSAGWPVNVTNPRLLPPPDELRDLPVAALLEALASTRPIYEAIVNALESQRKLADAVHLDPDLDPLRRYSSTGVLLHRARKLSSALAGLRRRLERPLTNREALDWRLTGPFGPVQLAQRFLSESSEGKFLEGEAAFALAELALTLSRVKWRVGGNVSLDEARDLTQEVLDELRKLSKDTKTEAMLTEYVQRAFAEATS